MNNLWKYVAYLLTITGLLALCLGLAANMDFSKQVDYMFTTYDTGKPEQ